MPKGSKKESTDRSVRVRGRGAVLVLVGALGLVVGTVNPAGAYLRPGETERVSVASDGTEANSCCSFPLPAMSADGRFVAWVSPASNLVPGDTNEHFDTFVRDRETGTTERVSVASDGAEANYSSTLPPAISADGRFVAFTSPASNLVPGDTNASDDVFVHDRETGTTERVSVATGGAEANPSPFLFTLPAISADGGHVAFASAADNLVAGDTNGAYDVFVRDRGAGTTERVSVADDGSEADSVSSSILLASVSPAISADGRHVAFASDADNLVAGDTNAWWDIFVRDRGAGTTERVSVASDGSEANPSPSTFNPPAISADGRHVAFTSFASNLVPGDTNGAEDKFVRDRVAGTTERVSVASDQSEANASSFGPPAISADGRHVAFYSGASNLVAGDTNRATDVFVRDRVAGTTERVSVSSEGNEANSNSSVSPAISADGRHVAFASIASNLVADDTNGAYDVFVRDRGPATGVGRLGANKAAGQLVVSGWATLSGAVVASADDPEDDGETGARNLGADIIAASVTHRPESEDLLLRLRLVSFPGPVLGGGPGVLYRWSFAAGEVTYEVRALRAAATAVPPGAPYFALYECAPSCTETARLVGGIGTTGAEVRVSVPLEALDVEEGAELTHVEASAGLGEAAPGPIETLDEVELPDGSIALPRVDLGIAPASAPQADVPFSVQADLTEGRFSGTLDVSSLPSSAHRVWARACLGDVCGTRSIAVAL